MSDMQKLEEFIENSKDSLIGLMEDIEIEHRKECEQFTETELEILLECLDNLKQGYWDVVDHGIINELYGKITDLLPEDTEPYYILPCKLCGSDPNHGMIDEMYSVSCDGENCLEIRTTGDYYTEIEAIKEWNKAML